MDVAVITILSMRSRSASSLRMTGSIRLQVGAPRRSTLRSFSSSQP
jgi:hypothetical protein